MLPATVDQLLPQWLQPDWNIPGVRAWCTTRAGDLSQPPHNGFNTANHVGDDPANVARCRAALAHTFHWSQEPQWLQQVHGTTVVTAAADGMEREGDAVITAIPGQVCTLHTADCLPVFFAARDGSCVGLAHAGWRGLAAGVLEATLTQLQTQYDMPVPDIHVWLGPAISQPAFEVGNEVRQVFLDWSAVTASCFVANANQRWQCDLFQLARLRLNAAGVTHITGGQYCTYSDPRFFSYRRQAVTGRLLSLIWIDPAQ